MKILSIFRRRAPLKPTAKGLKHVHSEDFKFLCKRLAASCVIADLPYEQLETRLRHVTVAALLPHRNYSVDEVADFYRANWQLVDGAWRDAISSMMQSIDRDQIGTLRRELWP